MRPHDAAALLPRELPDFSSLSRRTVGVSHVPTSISADSGGTCTTFDYNSLMLALAIVTWALIVLAIGYLHAYRQRQAKDGSKAAVGSDAPKADSALDAAETANALVTAAMEKALSTADALESAEKKKAPDRGVKASAVAQNATRLALLDHAKLYAMFLVILGHSTWLSNGFASIKEVPAWMDAIHQFVSYTHLHIFYMVSGYTSRAEISSDYVIASFVRLVLPVVLMQPWQAFTHPMYEIPSRLVSSLGTVPGDHFLVALFVLRCLMLPTVGRLSTRGLCLTMAGIYVPIGLTLARKGRLSGEAGQAEMNFNGDMINFALSYLISFLLGHLVKRHGLLTWWSDAVRKSWWLRLPFLAACVGLWVLAGFGKTLHGLSGQAFPRPGCVISSGLTAQEILAHECPITAAQFGWDVAQTMFKPLWSILYAIASVGWLPVDPLPWATTAGERTLFAYLLSTPRMVETPAVDAQKILMNPIATLVHRYGTEYWHLTFPADVLLLAALTSEFVYLAFWPLAEPIWALPGLMGMANRKGVEPVKSIPALATRYDRLWWGGWKSACVPALVAITFGINAANLLDMCSGFIE